MKQQRIISQTIASLMLALTAAVGFAQNNIAEEVAWVVGDQPIWKSEIEEQYNSMMYENVPINGDPYCVIPEMMAIEKLYLHQADLDTIEANESQVMAEVDARINYYIAGLGSKEKMEEYFRKPTAEIRQQVAEMVRNTSRIQQVQRDLTKNLKVTPSDVRRYFSRLPADSIPYIPQQVEVQIITINPVIPRQEIEDVKARLRSYADRVTSGETEFSTLAILYSEDPGSANRGGELGFTGRARLDPQFASVAFNLNDPKKVSKIVETDAGYHIIQLIEKRGDRINVRHILLKPHVSNNDLLEATQRLDSLKTLIDKGDVVFEDVVPYISQDKDTRNNRGVMVNPETGNSRFEMAQLPQEVAKAVATLEVGEVSAPFVMINPATNREVVALVKLTTRIDGHKANLSDDFPTIKSMYEGVERQRMLNEWLQKKINETYVRIEKEWRGCEFQHQGWIKERSSIAE